LGRTLTAAGGGVTGARHSAGRRIYGVEIRRIVGFRLDRPGKRHDFAAGDLQ